MVAGMSWVILREAAQTMPALLASGIAAYGILGVAEHQLQPAIATLMPHIASPVLQSIAGFLALLPISFLRALVLAAVAIPIHRLVLMDEKIDRPVKLFSARTLVFAGWLVALEFAYFAIPVPLAFLAGAPRSAVAVVAVLEIVGFVYMFYAVTRLSLLFPAVALGVPSESPRDRLGQAWHLSRGYFWRILVSALLAVIPLALATGLVSVVMLGFTIGLQQGLAALHTGWWSVLIETLSRPLGAVLGAAALSWNYRFATAMRR